MALDRPILLLIQAFAYGDRFRPGLPPSFKIPSGTARSLLFVLQCASDFLYFFDPIRVYGQHQRAGAD